MNDSWSSEDPAGLPPPPTTPSDEAGAEPARRADRHGSDAAVSAVGDGRRHPWVGLAILVVGLGVGGAGLASIALELDRPGVPEVRPDRWWLVVGGGLAAAWSAPWFLGPRWRRRMAVVLAVVTAAVLAVAAIAIAGLDG